MINRSLHRLLLLLLVVQPFTGRGQDRDKVTQHVPAQTLAIVTLWPSELAASKALQLSPREVLTAAGLESIGIDPLQLTRLDVMIGMPGLDGPQFGALIQSSVAIDVNMLNSELLDGNGVINERGYQYVQLNGPEQLIVHSIDEHTAVFGTKIFTKMMTENPDPASEIATILDAIKTKQDALAIISVNAIRPLLQGFAETAPLPPDLAKELSTVIEDTNILALRVLLGADQKLQLVVSTNNTQTATQVGMSIDSLIHFAREQILASLKAEFPAETATGSAMHAYFDRMGAEAISALKPQQLGARLVYEVKDFQNASIIGTLSGMLMPAIGSARLAARQMQSSNNLKQLGLALHNFESAYRQLPATAGLDDDGHPMISWRVAVLPFIEEAELYQEFNLDEPWDSEHNLALLERMPDVFKHPNRKTEIGYTVYQAAVGDDTLLQQTEPSRFANVTDGLSNTIMLVETTSERAVPWTAPDDYEFDTDAPTAGLFVKGITNFLFGDGSVQSMSEDMDIDTLKALFTRSGGEVFERPR